MRQGGYLGAICNGRGKMKSELTAVKRKGEKYLLETFLEVRIKRIG